MAAAVDSDCAPSGLDRNSSVCQVAQGCTLCWGCGPFRAGIGATVESH